MLASVFDMIVCLDIEVTTSVRLKGRKGLWRELLLFHVTLGQVFPSEMQTMQFTLQRAFRQRHMQLCNVKCFDHQ